ncbi:MAG: arginine--tRNA ligase, partial [Pseudomonadota bacterium]
MNLFAEIKELVTGTLDAMAADGVIPAGLDLRNVSVEPPRDPSHGDMATNAAMVLAKPAKMKPRDIADALAARLGGDARLASVEVAGPGFLNLRLVSGQWQRVIPAALSAGTRFGVSDLGVGVKVNVEYVSANPTGPLHIGHTRGAVFGDALAELLDFAGYDVTREYYINDGGGQVDTLARSVFERYREACGQAPQIAEGLYPGDYLIPVGQALKEQFGESLLGQNNEEWLPEVRAFATAEMMKMIRADLDALGVRMDVFFSEKSLYGTGRIEGALD